MKAGDIVKVDDGSWSMSIINGSLEHKCGNSLMACRFRVLSTGGEYPTKDHGDRSIKRNDTILIDENDSDHVLFTRQAYCCVEPPTPPAPPDTVDLTIPHGIRTVKLHLIASPGRAGWGVNSGKEATD